MPFSNHSVVPQPAAEVAASAVKIPPMRKINSIERKQALHILTRVRSTDGSVRLCTRDHRAFKRSESNIPLMVSVLLAGAFIVGTMYDRNESSIFSILAVIFAVFGAFCIAVLIVQVVVEMNTANSEEDGNSTSFRFIISLMNRLRSTYLNDLADNGVVLFSALSTGLNLVYLSKSNEDCSRGVLNNTLGCNPERSAESLPPEALFLCVLIVPVMQQLVSRCTGMVTVISSWAVILTTVNVSLATVNSSAFLWINLEIFLLMCMSFEWERRVSSHLQKAVSAVKEAQQASIFKAALESARVKVDEGNRLMEAKRATVRHISHEIRTPLNTIAIGVDVLEQELRKILSVPGHLLEVIDNIKLASTAALDVVNELLMFEKLAAGMTVLEFVPVALLDFLDDSRKMFEISARSKGVQLEFRHPAGAEKLAIKIDPVKMNIVLRNLISNAIKFSPSGGQVTVTAEVYPASAPVCTTNSDKILAFTKLEAKHFVVISVQDSGVGISKEDMEHLFEEGTQFHANEYQSGGGSGFGLYIAKGIVKLHDGARIWAESRGEGQGSTFFLRLPVVEGADLDGLRRNRTSVRHPGDRAVGSNSVFAALASKGNLDLVQMPKIHALVVDDCASNRKMHMMLLKQLGCSCVVAEDGLQAVGEVARMLLRRERGNASDESLDVILMDNNMPKMNGIDATVEMRKLGFQGKIIGATGGGNEEQNEFIQAGADVVIQKPLRRGDLSKVLGIRRSESSNPHSVAASMKVRASMKVNAARALDEAA